MSVTSFLFYILASLTGLCAIAVVVTQNIVRAAAWLLFALAGTAGVFFLLGADFVGATQLLVYVGGTLVLVVFGVMLTAQGPFVNLRISAIEWLIALAAGMLLYGVLAVSLINLKAPGEPPPSGGGAAPTEEVKLLASPQLAESLLGLKEATPEKNLTGLPLSAGRRPRTRTAYLLPFEVVSVHLLVVLIGAAYLARASAGNVPPRPSPEEPHE